MLTHRLPWVLALLLLSTGSAGLIAKTAGLPPGFDELVTRTQATFSVPGIAVAIVKDGDILLARAYGESKLKGRKADEHTRFAIASNTKAFTATALAILVDEGTINWTDPVVKHLPDFALNNAYVTENLNVRDLLLHNSGLPVGGGDLLWWPETTYTVDEAIHQLRYVQLAHSFREQYAYDNVLYGVAGQLISRVSAMPYEQFIQTRILNPLGMKDAAMQGTRAAKRSNTALPHAVIDDNLQVIEGYASDKANAAGGLLASASDMARWLQTLRGEGAITDDKRLISQANAKALWSIGMPLPVGEAPCGAPHLTPQFNGYALGFRVSDYRGYKTVSHGGGLPGFVSNVTMVPQLGLGIAIMTNQQSHAPLAIIRSTVIDHYLGVNDVDWFSATETCHNERMAKIQAAMADMTAKRVSGTKAIPEEGLIATYRDAWYGDIQIRGKPAGGLEIDFTKTPALKGDMEHWHYNTWIVRWRDAPLPPNEVFITFELDSTGAVIGARIKPVSPFTDFSYDFEHLHLKPLR